MNKRILGLVILPLLIAGCNQGAKDNYEYKTTPIETTRKVGEIGAFNLLTPVNAYSSIDDFVFTWEEASNSESYQIEISDNIHFYNDKDSNYVTEKNLMTNKFVLSYQLNEKDKLYYWRVTAFNSDHSKVSEQINNFFYESDKKAEVPILIEDAQDWTVHKEGSKATVSIDRNNFFGNNKDSVVIKFDMEDTKQGDDEHTVFSDGWIVISKSEDREIYGPDCFYMNFFYAGHDSNIFIRVLDKDGEYWHKQVQVSKNSKQTLLLKFDTFELRTATGSPIHNRKFDYQRILYFEVVFEKTFGDGVCILSDIKAVKFENYKDMFMYKMDFNSTDQSKWTYENYEFDKTISTDGSEITLNYIRKDEDHPNGFYGYGFQNTDLYRYLGDGDAIKLKVKYTETPVEGHPEINSSKAMFYFRILEDDMDRWQFKTSFSNLVKDEYTELVVPLKAFQRPEGQSMSGDGAKQMFFIRKLNFGLAENYCGGSISVKDVEMTFIDDMFEHPEEDRKLKVTSDGCIENFSEYQMYSHMYYFWDQSTVNKDEAMKLDTKHKPGPKSNTVCAEFDYKADLEGATYQVNLNSEAAVGKNAFQIYLRDGATIPSGFANDPKIKKLRDHPEKVSADMTMQLTLDTGEKYRYNIPCVAKDWTNYTIAFDDFELVDKDSYFSTPNPLVSDKVVHFGFYLQYYYKDDDGKSYPTYAISNPLYVDEIYFTNAVETSETVLDCMINEDPDVPGQTTVDTFDNYASNEDLMERWAYMTSHEANNFELSDVVSSQGGTKSLKMHYKGMTSISYGRYTMFGFAVKARGISIDIKGDGKVRILINLNLGDGKQRYNITPSSLGNTTDWYRVVIGFDKFYTPDGSKGAVINRDTMKFIDSITFGAHHHLYYGDAGDFYIDNIRMLYDIDYETESITKIS